MNLWTSDEVAKILLYLDEHKMPFEKYSFVREGNDLMLLGRGGSADVFEAEHRTSHKRNYAIKVIGFRKQNTDSLVFNESVEAQKELGLFQDNVVKVYDHIEMWITLDENDNVISAVSTKPKEMSRTTIKLQFIVMEKIASVIERTKGGNLLLTPRTLGTGDEHEILKLAYDIGSALKRAHNEKILHRDVKLENVFYSEKKGQYKLGDFGIAKKTEDGFARTIAFTKGYAAPEVRATDERYDNTADIYSFGMMLYVLVNNLRFPDSNTYNVNSSTQYSKGYIIPFPESDISEDFYYVIVKACMFNPDQRYQSMEEMILDIEKLMYGKSLGYKKEHKNVSLIVGSILLVLGVGAWKLTLAPEMMVSLSILEFIFWIGCLGKGILKILKKSVYGISIIVLGVGLYLLVSTGFTWIKLIILLWMVFSSGISSGYFASSIFITMLVSLVQQVSGANAMQYEEVSWIAYSLISLALVLLYQYMILSMEDRKLAKRLYRRGFYWIVICLVYALMFLNGELMNPIALNWHRRIFGPVIVAYLSNINIRMIGISGLLFCAFWIVREKILIHFSNRE